MTLTMILPILIVAWWLAAQLLFSLISGWSSLASDYRCDRSKEFQCKGHVAGGVGILNYNSCLWVAVTEEGLYLKTGPRFFFGLFHPPLLIPWSNISRIRECDFWVLNRVFEFELKDSRTKISIETTAIPGVHRYLAEKS